MTIFDEGFGDLSEFGWARSRFSNERRKLEKRFLGAVAGVLSAIAKVRKRELDLGQQQAGVLEAEEELAVTKRLVRASNARGHAGDLGGRAMSTTAYVILLVIAAFFQFTVDRGSLLVLELPLATSEILAAALVSISVLAAHWTGMIWRRAHNEVDPRTALGTHELHTGRVTLVGGIGLALGVAAVRGLFAGILSGILFALAGVVLFVAMCFGSYLHANGALDRHERARRACRRRARRKLDADGQLEKAFAAYHVACRNLVRVARGIVERIDQMLLGAQSQRAETHPGKKPPKIIDPPWLEELRRIADGQIPAELRLNPPVRIP